MKLLSESVRYYELKPIMAVNEIWLTVPTQIIDLVYNIYWSISAAEGSKSSGREGGHRTGQSLISIFFHNIFNSFSYLLYHSGTVGSELA